MTYPPHIQSLLEQGFAFEDSDGCVRLLPAYCGGGFSMPSIQINTYNITNNIYSTNTNCQQFAHVDNSTFQK